MGPPSNPFADFLSLRNALDPPLEPKQMALGCLGGKPMMKVAPPPTALFGAHDGPTYAKVDPWNCEALVCNHENAADSEICEACGEARRWEACGEARRWEAELEGQVAKPWHCKVASKHSGDDRCGQKCGYQNRLGERLCASCGTPRPGDSFASFLPTRPQMETQELQLLKVEVLRAKRELLKVALEAEQKAVSEEHSSEDAARQRRIRLAERYLYHPEKINEPLSTAGSDVGSVIGADDGPPLPPPPDGPLEVTPTPLERMERTGTPGLERTAQSGKERGLEVARSLPDLHGARGSSATPVGSARSQLSRHSGGSRDGGRPPSLGASLRAAGGALAKGTSSTGSLPALGSTAAESAGAGATPATSSKRSSPRDAAREQLLSGWWSKTRCFNLMIGKDHTQCRRQTLGMTGGCLAFGNGRMPLYNGAHLLTCGYYYCFKIKAMDTTRLPSRTITSGSALAVGVSRLSPAQPRLQGPMCPLYAYEVPGAVVVGYGAHVVEEGKWYKSPWDSNTLQIGDKVGVLVTPDGELVIFHNDKQVLRVQSTLSAGMPTGTSTSALQKKNYYAMVDLSGHISEVTMVPKAEPPNVPLLSRDVLERKLQ